MVWIILAALQAKASQQRNKSIDIIYSPKETICFVKLYIYIRGTGGIVYRLKNVGIIQTHTCTSLTWKAMTMFHKHNKKYDSVLLCMKAKEKRIT